MVVRDGGGTVGGAGFPRIEAEETVFGVKDGLRIVPRNSTELVLS